MNNKLKELRNKAGLTQFQLAEKVGTTRQNICNIENGFTNASVPLAKRIAKVLNVDWVVLFED